LRKDLPERHDKSYDSTVLDALNKGGFLYFSLRYLAWAKMLITVGVIRSLGNKAQDKAYKHLLKDGKLKELLKRKAKESNIDESAVEWVFKRVVDFAFHARSAVEWRKYKAAKTDRTTGKSKKMGIHEQLKGGGSTKKGEDH
jgi:hypothetical protein